MKIFITRKIPQNGIELLLNNGYEVEINQYDRILLKKGGEVKGYVPAWAFMRNAFESNVKPTINKAVQELNKTINELNKL